MFRNNVRRGTKARSAPNLVPIREAVRKRPFLGSEASLRDKWYHAQPRQSARGETIPPNGWARCFVKLGEGKRAPLLVDLDQLDALIENHRAAPIPQCEEAAA